MAIYHLSASIVKRSAGRSVTAAAAYRAASKIEDLTTGLVHDYSRKQGVDYSEIISPVPLDKFGNEWLLDREKLWNTIEAIEKRKDAQLAREITIAIPVELDRVSKIELVRAYVKANFVNQGMIADINIHHIDGNNPHAHVLVTMRNLQINPEGNIEFGLKNTNWNSKDLLLSQRKNWEQITNKYLAAAGSEAKIDCRSLEDQGSPYIPQIHLGVHAMAMKRKGIATDRSDEFDRIEAENNDIRARLEKIYEEEVAPESEPTQPYYVDESIEERDRKLGEISFELTKDNKSFIKFQGYTLKQHHQKYVEVRVDGGAKILDLKQEDEKWNISINYPKNTAKNYSENYVDSLVQHFEDCIRDPHNLAKNQESRNQIEKDRNHEIERELLQDNNTAKSIQKLLNLYDEKGRTFYPLRFEINKKADKIKVFDRWQGSRNHETIYEFYLVDNNWQKFLGNKRGIIPIHNLDTKVEELINQVNQVTDLKSVSYTELSDSEKEQIKHHYAKNGDLQDSYRVRYNKPDYSIEASRKMLEDGWDSEIVKSIFNNKVEKELEIFEPISIQEKESEPVTTLLEEELAEKAAAIEIQPLAPIQQAQVTYPRSPDRKPIRSGDVLQRITLISQKLGNQDEQKLEESETIKSKPATIKFEPAVEELESEFKPTSEDLKSVIAKSELIIEKEQPIKVAKINQPTIKKAAKTKMQKPSRGGIE